VFMLLRKQTFKIVEISSACIWVLAVVFFWMRGYEAQTAAQVSLSHCWLGTIACLGPLWIFLKMSFQGES
jgi:hypothetical protein